MVNGVLSAADLRAITGYERDGDVRRCLSEQGIRFFWGKEGVWTTIDLINGAAGLVPARGPDPHYPIDDFR